MKIHKHCSANFLVKLCYLLDALYFDSHQVQLSDLKYRLYTFGPFDAGIFARMDNIVLLGLLRSVTSYTRNGWESLTYVFNDENLAHDIEFREKHLPDISIGELIFLRKTLYNLLFYNDRDYTRMAYNTKPIKALGAKPGEKRGVGEILNFTCSQPPLP